MAERSAIYVASRASIPERSAMWRQLRAEGWNITSTWIDEAGEGETADFAELWQRIEGEIRAAIGVVLYAEPGDFPLKGALIEVGMAMGMGKPVACVLPGVELDGRTMRPLGSWLAHLACCRLDDLESARRWVEAAHRNAAPDRVWRVGDYAIKSGPETLVKYQGNPNDGRAYGRWLIAAEHICEHQNTMVVAHG